MVKFIAVISFISVATHIHYLSKAAYWRYKRPHSPSRLGEVVVF